MLTDTPYTNTLAWQAYVRRTAIGDSRIIVIDGDNVTFRWKDRANEQAFSGVPVAQQLERGRHPQGDAAKRRGRNH